MDKNELAEMKAVEIQRLIGNVNTILETANKEARFTKKWSPFFIKWMFACFFITPVIVGIYNILRSWLNL